MVSGRPIGATALRRILSYTALDEYNWHHEYLKSLILKINNFVCGIDEPAGSFLQADHCEHEAPLPCVTLVRAILTIRSETCESTFILKA